LEVKKGRCCLSSRRHESQQIVSSWRSSFEGDGLREGYRVRPDGISGRRTAQGSGDPHEAGYPILTQVT
jgi:hypothetical protein